MSRILLFLVITLSFSVFAQDPKKGAELFKQCVSCHGQNGEGNEALKAPKLSGQYDWYVLKQLQDMKAKKIRKNPAMDSFLQKLSDADMKDLASYITTL